ncbi:NAD dependent epimerase/dehydratase family protein [alpha proteobacterium HIMB5]|nr:NAD dependent epimerase/dehydratase family protein [alpha proteobacterium HIMB5]
MRKKKAIIIGGSGQLGISLSQKLLNKNFQVLITTRDVKSAKKKFLLNNKNLKIIKLDILNKNKIKFLLHQQKPQVIFYFAGQSSPSKSFIKKKLLFKAMLKVVKIF